MTVADDAPSPDHAPAPSATVDAAFVAELEGVIIEAVEMVAVSRLHLYHRNPRHGDVALIRRSLRTLSQYKPITVNRGTHTGRPDEVLAGNHTLISARDEGWSHIAVAWIDVDDDTAKRIVLIDNRSSDVAVNDDAEVVELLGDIEDPLDAGYEPGDVEAMRAMLDEVVGGGGGDAADQKVLDESDEAAWPVLRVPLPPEEFERWRSLPGADDKARVAHVLDALAV